MPTSATARRRSVNICKYLRAFQCMAVPWEESVFVVLTECVCMQESGLVCMPFDIR